MSSRQLTQLVSTEPEQAHQLLGCRSQEAHQLHINCPPVPQPHSSKPCLTATLAPAGLSQGCWEPGLSTHPWVQHSPNLGDIPPG